MTKHILNIILITTTVTIVATQSRAHVPHFEHHDFSEKQPFSVDYSIEQSLAVYAWLERDDFGRSQDIWRFRDIIQAFRYTPRIRLDLELHLDCSDDSDDMHKPLDVR